MRTVPLELPLHLVESATLYAPTRHPLDAVCYVLQDYPSLVSQLRSLHRRIRDLEHQDEDLNHLLEQLQAIARRILSV